MKLFGRKTNDGDERFGDRRYHEILQVLQQIAEHGVDLAQPRLIEHFLYMPDESSARDVEPTLKAEAFVTEVGPSAAESGDWLIKAQHTIVPDPRAIWDWRLKLGAIAESVGGEYDGWGSPL